MIIKGGCIFEIMESTKGANSGSLTISGRGWPKAYHAAMSELEYFTFGLELWADFLTNACKM